MIEGRETSWGSAMSARLGVTRYASSHTTDWKQQLTRICQKSLDMVGNLFAEGLAGRCQHTRPKVVQCSVNSNKRRKIFRLSDREQVDGKRVTNLKVREELVWIRTKDLTPNIVSFIYFHLLPRPQKLNVGKKKNKRILHLCVVMCVVMFFCFSYFTRWLAITDKVDAVG